MYRQFIMVYIFKRTAKSDLDFCGGDHAQSSVAETMLQSGHLHAVKFLQKKAMKSLCENKRPNVNSLKMRS